MVDLLVVNIWNLLWLSSRLIIWAEPNNIYTSTFPNTCTLTPKLVETHEISVCFQQPRSSLMLRTVITPKSEIRWMPLSWKVVNNYKFSTSYVWLGKTFSDSKILPELRIWRRHVNTLSHRGSLHKRSFRCIHVSVVSYRSWLKMALQARNVSGSFEIPNAAKHDQNWIPSPPQC